MTDTMLLLPGLSLVEGKPLTATFDAGRLSSDMGSSFFVRSPCGLAWPKHHASTAGQP
jgi:hypothetical protein